MIKIFCNDHHDLLLYCDDAFVEPLILFGIRMVFSYRILLVIDTGVREMVKR